MGLVTMATHHSDAMPVPDYVLALDQGTTSSRAIVFDADGQPRALAQREFTQHFPQPGWVEHDPAEIWSTQAGVAAEALARARVDARQVAAIGITNQRETVVVWDRTNGEPIHRAIVWQDRRSADACAALAREGLEAEVTARTGLLLDPYFSATKIAWLLDTVPGARAAAEAGRLAFGTVDTWLAWRLSGGALHLTDASNASRTLLWNIHAGDWDDELLRIFRVPRALLPRVVDSSGVVGEAVGVFSAPIPIAALVGDQQAALFGQACHSPGMAKNTYGTGCFAVMHTGKVATHSTRRLLTTCAWRLGGRLEYALEGSVFVAGAAVQWLRDGLGIIRQAADVEALAASVADSGGVYLVPAFTGLGAPHWDAWARGAILGLTRASSAAHIARAALEAIALQTAEVLDAMQDDSGAPLKELRVDGGAAANDLLMQIQADVLGVPVVRPRVTETTALGAAYLAGIATGVWSGPEDVAGRWQAERRFEPAADPARMAELRAGWARAVERAKGWGEEGG